MGHASEERLPAGILAMASCRRAGDEYAWRIEHIPQVIEAARYAGLVSIGDQLVLMRVCRSR